MRSFLYIKREGDELLYANFWNTLSELDDAALNERFEAALKTGLVGVHAQGVYLFTLWKKGRERNLRFATDSNGGIQIEDGRIITLRPLSNEH